MMRVRIITITMMIILIITVMIRRQQNDKEEWERKEGGERKRQRMLNLTCLCYLFVLYKEIIIVYMHLKEVEYQKGTQILRTHVGYNEIIFLRYSKPRSKIFALRWVKI